MTSGFEDQTYTKQHPVDTGVENAKNKFEESYSDFRLRDVEVSQLTEDLRGIWEEIQNADQTPLIQEEFATAIFELIALTQFSQIRAGNEPLNKSKLKELADSLIEIIETWLRPKPLKK